MPATKQAFTGARIFDGAEWHDHMALVVADGKVEGRDLIATVLHALGLPPDAELRDTEGRPFPASRGKVLHQIL